MGRGCGFAVAHHAILECGSLALFRPRAQCTICVRGMPSHEAFFLLDQGHSPFVHGQCSVQPPLLLATMRLLRLLSAQRAAAMEASLVLFSDLACAWLLRELSVSRMAGTIASLAFLLAPWSIAACAVRSTGTLASALLLFSAKHAARARCAVRGAGEADAMVALVALAMAIHLSPDMIWMVAPVGALSVTRVSSTPGELSRLAPHLMVVFFIALLVPCVRRTFVWWPGRARFGNATCVAARPTT